MPLQSPDTTQLNQIALRLAAGLASALALLAVLLHQELLPGLWKPKATLPPLAKKVIEPAAETPSITEAPSITISEVSVQPRIAFCAQHVTPERSFVIFENGTCVIINEPSESPISEAKEILTRTSGAEVRFITRKIEDGHLMITYREPVFHCLFAPEIEDLSPTVAENFSNYLSPEEKKSMPENWTPPADAKLGLYSRSLLNLDASHMTVAKVVKSRPIVPEEQTPLENTSKISWKSSRPAPLHVIADGTKLTP